MEALVPDEVLVLIFSSLHGDAEALCQWNVITMENELWEEAVRGMPELAWKNWHKYRDVPGGLRNLLVAEARKRKEFNMMLGKSRAEYDKHSQPAKSSSPLTGMPRERQSIKLVCVGTEAVGKTCTIISYTTNNFPCEYIPSVLDNCSANVQVSGVSVSLDMWDNGDRPPEDYARLRPLSYPKTDVFLVCFSLICRDSFLNVKAKWVPEITHYCPNVPFILAGTKLDLLSGESDQSRSAIKFLADNKRMPITVDEGKQMARETGAAGFISYSTLTRQNLELLFDECIKAALRTRGGRGCITS